MAVKDHRPASPWGFTTDERLLIAGVALLVVIGLAAKYVWLRGDPEDTVAPTVEGPA